MCGQHNVRTTAGDNTEQNTDRGHSPRPSIEIKIPDPAGNRTQATGQEGMEYTNHAMDMDNIKSII